MAVQRQVYKDVDSEGITIRVQALQSPGFVPGLPVEGFVFPRVE
jgi:hypothetical protein